MLRPAELLVGGSKLAVSTSCPPKILIETVVQFDLRASLIGLRLPADRAPFSLLCACFTPGAQSEKRIFDLTLDPSGSGSAEIEILYAKIGDWVLEAVFLQPSSLTLLAHALWDLRTTKEY